MHGNIGIEVGGVEVLTVGVVGFEECLVLMNNETPESVVVIVC